MERKTIELNPNAEQINVRIDRAVNDGFLLLLYKDARFDVLKLNEMFGEGGWSADITTDNNSLPTNPMVRCTIKAMVDGQVIERSDYGDDAANDIKSKATDALKRASFRFGIGQALYTGPARIFVPNESVNLAPGSSSAEPARCYDDFVVDEIEYSEDQTRITSLIISDVNTDKVVFDWKIEDDRERRKKRLDAYKALKEADKAETTDALPTAPAKPAPAPVPAVAPAKPEEAKKSETAPKPATRPSTKKTAPKADAVTTPVIVRDEAPKAPVPTTVPSMSLRAPVINGNENDLNMIAPFGNKKGKALREHRPIELAILFGKDETPDEIKDAIRRIADKTDSVKTACIKRGYGEIITKVS